LAGQRPVGGDKSRDGRFGGFVSSKIVGERRNWKRKLRAVYKLWSGERIGAGAGSGSVFIAGRKLSVHGDSSSDWEL
jgi:hypothetical protein